MEKFGLGQDRSCQKNFSRFSYSKSTCALITATSFIFVFSLSACKSKESKSQADITNTDLVHFDSLEGEVHQLTTKGNNSDIYFSPHFDQLVFVHNEPQLHATPQIYVKDMINKMERRLSFNLGENFHPQLHPYKKWVVYSSSASGAVEKINIDPVMKDLGLNQANAKATDKSLDIFVLSEDSSDIKRITRSKGIEHLATFSPDGEKIIYVSQGENNAQVVQYTMSNGQKKVLLTSSDLISSMSVSQDLIAYTTPKSLIVKKLKGQGVVFQSPDGFYFGDVNLNQQDHRLLAISNLEDKLNKDVYLLDLDKKCSTRLTFHPSEEFSPTFGPEGKSLFFVSNRSQSKQIYSMMIRESLPCKPWP